MAIPALKVLVVDDYEPWRSFESSMLQTLTEFLVIGEVSDGLEAVEKAQELQPDLILLDCGLPILNGIEAAKRIRQVSPNSKIIFVTQNNDRGVRSAALATGAEGYLIKANAATELLPAVQAALRDHSLITTASAAQAEAHRA